MKVTFFYKFEDPLLVLVNQNGAGWICITFPPVVRSVAVWCDCGCSVTEHKRRSPVDQITQEGPR